MRMLALAFAAPLAFVSVPALAKDAEHSDGAARIEARGGMAWYDGHEEAVVGLAAGYDFNLGESGFFGVEASGEKLLVSDADVEWGISGRLGAEVTSHGALFAVGGYTFGEGEEGPHVGAGYEHHLGNGGLYLATEYRHLFGDHHEVNTIAFGIGTKF